MHIILSSISKIRCIPICVSLRSTEIIKNGKRSPFRALHTSRVLFKKDNEGKEETLPMVSLFNVANKNKDTFKQAVEIFKKRDPHRKSHIEFIYAALKYMEEFGVESDLESYKNLIQVLPKGKYIPRNVFQSEFLHFPKQQLCIVDVLDAMERKGVVPDLELGEILKETFGKTGIPVRKFHRMLYWLPKFKHANPWPVPSPTPKDAFILAKLAIERIMSVDKQSVVTVFNTKDVADAVDDTWIVSGQSPDQQRLLNEIEENTPVHVEGPFLIWLRKEKVQYFTLRADPSTEPEPEPADPDDVSNLTAPWAFDKQPSVESLRQKTVHEQEDGTILSVCATGTSSRDSLLSWIRLLERHNNPKLGSIPVLFKLRSATTPNGEEALVEVE